MGTVWFCALLASASMARPQAESPSVESVTVVLSPRIRRPSVPGFLRGHGWRKLWSDSLRLGVLRTPQLDSGPERVRPERGELAGVLRVQTHDGRVFRLLPADRDPVSATLPPHLRATGLARALRDLVATSHPTAPLVAAALYRSAGLAALEPDLGVLSAGDTAIEGARPLAGRPIWIERAPELDALPWGPFTVVISSDSLLARMRRDPATRVDLSSFLAARLLDLVLSDRDRRPSHWLWGDSTGADTVWVPIAVRQEDAFLDAGGPGRLVLSLYQPGYGRLDPGAPDVAGLSSRSVDFERPLLARIERRTWDSVATALADRLTDPALEAALARLPEVHRRQSGETLRRILVSRREALPEIAARLYRLVATYPDIELSDCAETVLLTRSPEGDVDLLVQAGGREVLRRRFLESETEELRLHLEAGDDTVRLATMEHGGVGVRITSRQGTVRLIREGWRTRRVVLYTEAQNVAMEPPKAVRLVPRTAGRWIRWRSDDRPPVHPDWGSHPSPVLALRIGGDLGLTVGAGLQWKWYGFGERDYRQWFRSELRYLSSPSTVGATVAFERRDLLRNLHLAAEAEVNGMSVVRFYGYGNQSRDSGSGVFHRVDTRDFTLSAGLALSSRPELAFRLGPVLALSRIDTTATRTLIGASRPYGTGRFNRLGLAGRLAYAPVLTRYHEGLGWQLVLDGSLWPGWWDVTRGGYSVAQAEGRLFWVPGGDRRFMLATRLGGGIGAGRVPFPQAFRLGGATTLRGYSVDRFTGDRAAAYGALELRVRAARAQIGFLPLDLGILAFGDAGRVWSRNDHGATLHQGWGGGVWGAPALGWIPAIDALVLRLDFARSVEGTNVSVGTGFRF